MASVRAEYTDGAGSFAVESVATGDAAGLVGALETVQVDFNARLTSLIEAEKAAVAVAAAAVAADCDTAGQCKRQKSEH
ncbi:hypothetical protein H4R19_004287 [Coemansia spiralis]|nr:hypothetical protein H4R19_004287 [Coemansia spiralis]